MYGKVGKKLSNQNNTNERNIYCHVGLPKTATSFLQKKYFPLGFDHFYSTYPPFDWPKEFDWIRSLNHLWLSSLFNQERLIERSVIESKFKAETQKYINVWNKNCVDWESQQKVNSLLSAEGLCGLSLPVAETIASLLKHAGVRKILFTYRRQSDWSYSLWSQLIMKEDRFAKHVSFEDLFGNSPNPEHDTFIDMNWAEYLKMYHTIFGTENVLAIPYELMKTDSNLFFARIGAFLNIDKKLTVVNEIENPSVENTCYFSWKTDSIWPLSKLPMVRLAMHRYLTPHIKKATFVSNYLLKEHAPFNMSLAFNSEIMNHFKNCNKELADLSGFDLSKYDYYS